MSILTPSALFGSPGAGTPSGFGPVAGVAAAQRAALARGVAFALLLASSSLACVYIPAVAGGGAQGPDWVEGSAPAQGSPAR